MRQNLQTLAIEDMLSMSVQHLSGKHQIERDFIEAIDSHPQAGHREQVLGVDNTYHGQGFD